MAINERSRRIRARMKERADALRLVRQSEREATVEAIALGGRFPDETQLEHAKRIGVLGEAIDHGALGCRFCADLLALE